MEGQKPVGLEQQVTRNASESLPHQLSQKGWWGEGEAGREEEMRRGRGGGGGRGGQEDREEGNEQELEKTGGRCPTHPPG